VGDFDLVLRINEEIKADKDKPVLQQDLYSLDDVEVELLCLEADDLVDKYMQQYRAKYAGQFERPEIFDALVEEYRKLMRRNVREFIAAARELLDEGTSWGDGDGI